MMDEANRQCPDCRSYSVRRIRNKGSLEGGLSLPAVGGILFWQSTPSAAARTGLCWGSSK